MLTNDERKARNKIYRAKWRANNRASAKASTAKWRSENPARVKAQWVRYRAKNSEKITVRDARYRASNPEKIKARRAAQYANNKAVVNTKNREWRAKNPDKIKDIFLKRQYGISLNEYNRMLDEQAHACAICQVVDIDHAPAEYPGKSKTLHVDHHHVTKKVRGLLCSRCNPLLGYARDSVGTLQGATQYLLDRQ